MLLWQYENIGFLSLFGRESQIKTIKQYYPDFDEDKQRECIERAANICAPPVMEFKTAYSDKFTLIYSANGRRFSYSKYTGDWPLITMVSSIDEASAAEIAPDTFLNHKELKGVIIPARLKEIGERAFMNCTSLESISIPQYITKINSCTFAGCPELKTVVISEGVSFIAEDAFEGSPNVVFYTPKGSYAESFAVKNNIPYRCAEIHYLGNEVTYTCI